MVNSLLIELLGIKFLIFWKINGLKYFFNRYESEGTPDFLIKVTDEDIAREELANYSNDGWQITPVALEFFAIQRQIVSYLSNQGVLLFHGSAICVDGRTYIFFFSSGTGKSTHTRLWREMLKRHDVVMVNDDKPFLKVEEGRVTAYGSPWMGKEKLGCKMSAPVEAICSISQGSDNVIREATPEEMYPIFYEQSLRPFDKEGTENYLHTLDVLTRSVRLYKLKCDISLEAARMSYEIMAGKLSREQR